VQLITGTGCNVDAGGINIIYDDHAAHVREHRLFTPETVWITNDGELLIYVSFESRFYNDLGDVKYPDPDTVEFLGEL
jgi:hypothetical protein